MVNQKEVNLQEIKEEKKEKKIKMKKTTYKILAFAYLGIFIMFIISLIFNAC